MSRQHSREGSADRASPAPLDPEGGARLKHRPGRPSADTDLRTPEADGNANRQRAGKAGWARAPLAALARCSRHRRALCAVALALGLLLLTQRRQLRRHAQNVAAALYYGLDPGMLGRSEDAQPSPRCCADEGCAADPSAGHRTAVVTYLRGPGEGTYLPLLRQLECTLQRSNPGAELGVMAVPGELGAASLAALAALNITLLPVAPLEFPNAYDPQYARNWLKVRALGLTQYRSLLLVDCDVAVAGPLAPLWGLPFEAAAVWDQSRWLSRYRTVLRRHNGGVWLLRPCAAVEAHMLRLLREAPKLRFTHRTAEQDFLSWYHRYTAATLPLQWNCQAAQCLVGGRTVGGAMPRIVHFAGRKPSAGAGISPGGAGHQFLCSAEQLEARARGEPVGPAALPDAALGGLAAAAPGVPASQPALGSLPR